MNERTSLPPRSRLPLRRPYGNRWVGGVCSGLALHLEVPVAVVRAVMVLLALAGGAGIAAYVMLWLTVPPGNPRAVAEATRPAAQSRLAPRLVERAAKLPIRDIAIGVVLLVGAALLIGWRAGATLQVTWLVPVLVALGGLALAWSQLDATERGRLIEGAGGHTPIGVVRLAGGILLVLLGVMLFVVQNASPGVVVQAAFAALAVLAGAALVLAPWWLRLVRELGDERAARARESERADIAAHLHDSVLQTLALIRAQSHDADTVARLARAQERELREWLYDDRPVPGTSLAAELKELVGEVEDGRIGQSKTVDGSLAPTAIDTVIVGDCVPSSQTAALLQATREALVNAVAHGKPPISLYMEVTDDEAMVFVRDRGEGFEPAQIPADRFGVRESIMGRTQRRGGSAELRSRPGWGTEVRLRVPRSRPSSGRAADSEEESAERPTAA